MSTLLLALSGLLPVLAGAPAPDPAQRFAERWSALSEDPAAGTDLLEAFDPAFVARQGAESLEGYLRAVARGHPHSEEVAVLPTADGGAEAWFACGLHAGHVVAALELAEDGIADVRFRREDVDGLPAGMASADTLPAVGDVLGDWLERLAERSRFSGAVLLSTGDETLLRTAHGTADVTHRVPCRPTTRFGIGSINKCFTALLVAQLVEEGALDLDATLGEVDATFACTPAAGATVRQLLTHTGGLGDYVESIPPDVQAGVADLGELVALVRDDPVGPAGPFRYSNTGYLALGAVVEAVTGRSYYDVVQRRVFEPLGMDRTGHASLDRGVPDLATGYFLGEDGTRFANTRILMARGAFDSPTGGPAGGGYSCVDDLARFARALLRSGIDGADVLLAGLEPGVPTGEAGARYGFGLEARTTEGNPSFGHTGGFAGLNAWFEAFPAQDAVVVLLANHEGAVELVAPRVRELLARASASD